MGDPFGVDVGFGDVLTEGPDVVEGSDVLNFTLLGIFFIPALFVMVEKLKARKRGKPDQAREADRPTHDAPAESTAHG